MEYLGFKFKASSAFMALNWGLGDYLGPTAAVVLFPTSFLLGSSWVLMGFPAEGSALG